MSYARRYGIWLLPLGAAAAVVAASLAAESAQPARARPAAVAMMIGVEGEAARYWPRWRGPSGQGLVEGSGYPDRWSPSENIRWRAPLPGAGNSSPIVWADRIFLTTAYDGGARRSILCLRRSDGKLLWEAFAPGREPERVYHKNGHASSTPATDGERVYAYLGNQGILAVDFEGRQVWHRGLGEMNVFHGPGGSPLLYKDRLILYQDQRRPAHSFIAAFELETGKTIWWKGREENTGWGTPVAVRTRARDEIVVSSQHHVRAYDPASGEELWRCAGNLFEVTPTPVAGLDLVFATSGRAGPTLAIRPGGSGDVTGSHIVWQSPKGSPFIPSPILDRGLLYMVNDMASVATCYDGRTGRLMWQGRLGAAARESFSASPVAVEDKIYFTNDNGETFVLAAGPEFRLLHVNQLGERVLASPALVDGTWYFRTERHLVAIGAD